MQSFQRKTVIPRAVRRLLDTDNGILIETETIEHRCTTVAMHVRIEHREQEISVVLAAPTPVDVEIVGIVVIIAVADKRMSASAALSAVCHRPACGQLAINQVHPIGVTVVFPIAMAYAAVVAEAGLQCIGNRLTIGRRSSVGAQTVFHLERYAAVLHQSGHCALRIIGR